MNRNVTVGNRHIIQGDQILANESVLVSSSNETALTVSDGSTNTFVVDTLNNEVTVNGNLTISGTTTTISSTDLEIEDTLIVCGSGNNGDSTDMGLLCEYTNSGTKYAGLIRDAGSDDFYLVENLTAKTNPVSTSDLADLHCSSVNAGLVQGATDVLVNASSGNDVKLGVDGNYPFWVDGGLSRVISRNTVSPQLDLQYSALAAVNFQVQSDSSLDVKINDMTRFRFADEGFSYNVDSPGTGNVLSLHADQTGAARLEIANQEPLGYSVISMGEDTASGNQAVQLHRFNSTYSHGTNEAYRPTSFNIRNSSGPICFLADGTTSNDSIDFYVQQSISSQKAMRINNDKSVQCYSDLTVDGSIECNEIGTLGSTSGPLTITSEDNLSIKVGNGGSLVTRILINEGSTVDFNNGGVNIASHDLTVGGTCYIDSIDGVDQQVTVDSSAGVSLRYDGNTVLQTSLTGIQLASGSTSLSHYEESTMANTISGGSFVGTQNITLYLRRIGKLVTCSYTGPFTAGDLSSSGAINLTTSLGTNFRPNIQTIQYVPVISEGSIVRGSITVSTDGSVDWIVGDSSSFPATGSNCGLVNTSISWTV